MHARASEQIPTGREVLIVEDEIRLRTMLSQAVTQMGYTPTLVSTAEAAVKAVAQRSFDIVILDLNLPGMGGIELLEHLRKHDHNAQAIILTGFGDLESARKAIHLDVADFLTKPCALGTLEIALERARKRRRGQIVGQAAAAPELALEFDPPPEMKPALAAAAVSGDQPLSMEDLERHHILSVLTKHHGNRSATADCFSFGHFFSLRHGGVADTSGTRGLAWWCRI